MASLERSFISSLIYNTWCFHWLRSIPDQVTANHILRQFYHPHSATPGNPCLTTATLHPKQKGDLPDFPLESRRY